MSEEMPTGEESYDLRMKMWKAFQKFMITLEPNMDEANPDRNFIEELMSDNWSLDELKDVSNFIRALALSTPLFITSLEIAASEKMDEIARNN